MFHFQQYYYTFLSKEAPFSPLHYNFHSNFGFQVSMAEANPLKRKSRRTVNRWWRISDDKIKESKTSEVLGMQKEVYLLFYELDR